MSLPPGIEAEPYAAEERRRSHRYPGPFRAIVRGVTAGGGEVAAAAEVKDVSAGGAYLRLDGAFAVGQGLTIEIFVAAGQQAAFGREGEVVRAEPLIDGRLGAAVKFNGGELGERHS